MTVKRTSIYDRQTIVKWECQKGVYKRQAMSIDCKPLSDFVPSECQVYNSRGVSIHCKRIHGLDYFDRCKVATALRKRKYKHYTQKCQVAKPKYQIIDKATGQVLYTVKECHVKERVNKLHAKGVKVAVKQA